MPKYFHAEINSDIIWQPIVSINPIYADIVPTGKQNLSILIYQINVPLRLPNFEKKVDQSFVNIFEFAETQVSATELSMISAVIL